MSIYALDLVNRLVAGGQSSYSMVSLGLAVHTGMRMRKDEVACSLPIKSDKLYLFLNRCSGGLSVRPIVREEVQAALQPYVQQDVYVHLETTNGAYAAENQRGPRTMAVTAYIRNAAVRLTRATMAGTGPYRAGLQMEQGWIYAEGLTDWEIDEQGRLLLAGHDADGRLAIALQLSKTPFPV